MRFQDSSQTEFVLIRTTLLLALYALLTRLFPHSIIPISALLLGMASTFYKTRSFNWLLSKFINLEMQADRQALVDAVVTYERYITDTLAWNNHKIRTLKRVEWEWQKQAREIGYYDHLQDLDKCTMKNGDVTHAIAKYAIDKYAISPLEKKAGMYKPNSKAIEALCHYARDWSPLGKPEYKPVMDYINSSIDRYLPNAEHRKRTLVIVPGSGLGRVAHELAQKKPGFRQIESVEFSGMMYLANEFIYAPSTEQYSIFPYIHTYSHHVNTKNQLREVSLHKQIKPDTLKMNFADIRTFTPTLTSEEYDTVLIVTCFFLDTAQNVFEYFASIERLIGNKKGLWINVGPLKYGTAPKVEFNLEELRKLRALRGWKDVDEPKPYGKETCGYLTDVEGLWQGYYGLGRWTSTFGNK